MMTLDNDELRLAVTALRHVADVAAAQSTDRSMSSGCAGATKACIDNYCLPKLKTLIDRIQQHMMETPDGD